MKSFVIKNKEGKYLRNKTDWVPNLYGAKLFLLKEDADTYLKTTDYELDDEVVEITIEEVDKNLTPTNYDSLSIEDKLKYRENQVGIARDRDVEYANKITELEFTIKRKEEELAEKGKKINQLSNEHLEMFGDMKTYKNLWLAEQRKNKEIRKQVCDEIRDGFNNIEFNCNTDFESVIAILDKVEREDKL